MIEKLELKNFRAYKDQEINFHKGVNSIVGSSDTGKSTVLRAFYWAFQNRPLGKRMISNWNRDKKGEPKEETSVEVKFDNGSFIRELSPDFNGYIHGKKKSEALKGAVPDSCLQLLNFSEVNIQKQHDNLFMIADSAGQTARLLNRVLNIENIEIVLQRAESTKRNLKKDITYKSADLDTEKEKLSELDWLDSAEKLSNKITKVSERIERQKETISEIESIMQAIKEEQEKQEAFKDIPKVEKLLLKIGKEIVFLNEENTKGNRLNSLVESTKERLTRIKDFDFVAEAGNGIDKIFNLLPEVEYKQLEYNAILQKTELGKTLDIQAKAKQNEITALEKQLPETCPLCGGKI